MIDYKELGFKSGIEIHQQLDTNKLFCNCPSIISDKVDNTIIRKLRVSASELGELDLAALHEVEKDKLIEYEYSNDYSCLVELDDEPIHNINKKALEIAIEISLLLKAKVLDEIIVMRKVVIDGSNTSGFQRTMLLAVNGRIETSKGTIKIPAIYLEEEAARKIKEDNNIIRYRLDRLGIPLVEITTDSSIEDNEHAKEVASKIGMILRSTGKIKRGLGTIRQDLNLSIKNMARVELKGVQDLRAIPKIIENEVRRQLNLINENRKIIEEVRRIENDFTSSFLRPMPGAARMYPETDIKTIKINRDLIEKIELPELIADKSLRLEEAYELSEELASEIIKKNINFEHYVNKFKNIKPSLIAHILVEVPKEIKARYKIDVRLKEKDFENLFVFLDKGMISKESVVDILAEFAKGKEVDIGRFKTVNKDELEKEIKKIIEENKNASFNAIMGIVMERFKRKIDGKKASEMIRKLL